MELTKALDILKNKSTALHGEADAVDLAISVLEEKFAPQLQVLENARNEVTEKTAVIAQHEQTISALEAEKVELNRSLEEVTATVTQLTEENISLRGTPTETIGEGEVLSTSSAGEGEITP